MTNEEKNLVKTCINWYPGHMVKAQNEIKSDLKLIDIVIEVVDARIPISSRNKIIDKLVGNKKRIIVLNKSDLADDKLTLKWKKYFEDKGFYTIITNANISENIKKIIDGIKKIGNSIYSEKYKNSKIEIKHIYRCLVVGIPNVGKSTIINKIANRQVANVANKPGVTVKKQWIRVDDNIELLDTPGLLWPNLSEKDAGLKLALVGSIKEEILDVEELACNGIEYIKKSYKENLASKYLLEECNLDMESYEILEKIGRKKGCLIAGGNVDTTRAAKLFLDDLRNAKIGKVTLDEI